LEVVGDAYQRIQEIDPATFIGSGKVQEIKSFVEDLQADLVIFDDELSPRHQRELEKALGEDVQVLDRTALILDIFAQHAQTREGALQVELAQYEYRLPRLTRRWTHLARQAGGAAGRGGTGGVGLRGPGETQLEVDRREIGKRITRLKRELEDVRAHRQRYRAQRRRAALPVVAIVGYTNAGKSTLLNALAHANVYAADQLFATLDPTTRRVRLPAGRVALFTDTVGFIQKLPTTLVAAFRATLEEIGEADLLLHVVDITHPNVLEQGRSVEETLAELGAGDKPVVTALNKIDQLDADTDLAALGAHFSNPVAISAEKHTHLEDLLARIEHVLFESLIPVEVRLPYKQAQLLSQLHEQGVVEREEHGRDAILVAARVPVRFLETLKPYLLSVQPDRT
jgi:GTP-binding protein HflX